MALPYLQPGSASWLPISDAPERVGQSDDVLAKDRLPHTAAEDLLEIVMRRYERASTLITSNRPVEDWGKLLGDTAAVTALSTGCCITRTSSRAARAAGAPGSTANAPSPARDPVDDAARSGSEPHDLGGGRYRGIPPKRHLLSLERTRYHTLA